jgi:hypothetical protein
MTSEVDSNLVKVIASSCRVESLDPASYRLLKKKSGELVLQGAYFWQDGSNHGYEWRDIETEIEDD